MINDVIADSNYDIRIENYKEDDLFNSDEVFITNSTQGILPITHINDKQINNSICYEVTKNLREIFISKIH